MPTGPALLTDRYELTMVAAALADGTADRDCVFEVFARRLPHGRRYGVVAGTGPAPGPDRPEAGRRPPRRRPRRPRLRVRGVRPPAAARPALRRRRRHRPAAGAAAALPLRRRGAGHAAGAGAHRRATAGL